MSQHNQLNGQGTTELNRRQFAAVSAGAIALTALGEQASANPQAQAGWNQGQLLHLIPTANHERFLIKASFKARVKAPRLTVDGKGTDGVQTDPQGRFWRFDVSGLNPATTYTMRIIDAGGAPLCDAWPLKTFPAPNAKVERLRILAYTCGGGFEGPRFENRSFFLDLATRRHLLARALSFQPDVVIANGDHIYWDIKTNLNKPFAKFLQAEVWPKFGGALNIAVPMLHPQNAAIFLAVCDHQIQQLYGTTLRSTPAFFITDDHDLFENDEYDANLATLPPDTYGILGAEQTQSLYYPEFLPDANRPAWLPGGDKAGNPPGTNMSFGTLRYGTLLEAVLYECRRYVDYKGAHAKILPQWTEDWLIARTRAQDTTHFFHAPSQPFAYSSGKLGDWYPDLLDARSGRLVVSRAKQGWQHGWLAQHQRLLEALATQKNRQGVIVQGDFHALAAGKLTRCGELSMPKQPVHVVMAGPMGTGEILFPSYYRGIGPMPSQLVGMEEAQRPLEKNGFTIIDVTADKMTFTLYAWKPPQPVKEIDTMKPLLVYEVPRR